MMNIARIILYLLSVALILIGLSSPIITGSVRPERISDCLNIGMGSMVLGTLLLCSLVLFPAKRRASVEAGELDTGRSTEPPAR